MMEGANEASREEIGSHSIRANHELIVDLGKAKEALEQITHETPDVFGLVTREGRVIRGNLAYASLAGVEEEQVFGTQLDALFSDESWRMLSAKIGSADFKSKSSIHIELPIDRIDATRLFHWTFTPFAAVSSRRGAIFSFIGKDITALRNYERKLAAVFSAIPLGVVSIDRNKKIEWPWSQFAEILLGSAELDGASAEDVIFGRSLSGMTVAERAGVKTFFDQIGGEETWYDMVKGQFPREIPIVDSDGQPTAWRSLSYNPVVHSGVVEKVLIVIEDVTDRVRSRLELTARASQEQKLAQTIVDLQASEPMLLGSCMEDVDLYLAEIGKLESEPGSARAICNALHGIKGVARAVNLRAFKDLIHETEQRILSGAKVSNQDVTADMRRDVALVQSEWLELRRFISVFRSREGETKSAFVDDSRGGGGANRDAIERAIIELKSQVPSELHGKFARLEEQVAALGRIPITTLEPKIDGFFNQTMRRLGRQARLVCDWSKISISRDIAPTVCEIFYHLLTNALDHGIESADERIAAGKNPEGKILVRAQVESERLLFVVEDDGRGIDTTTLLERARAKGLFPDDRKYTDQEIWSLALVSEVSTAKAITDTSGRGIGLSAVDERIRRLGGNGLVISQSIRGKGTKFEFFIVQST